MKADAQIHIIICTIHCPVIYYSILVYTSNNIFQVSWIRKATHPIVLSSGAVTFTSDSRVSVINLPGTEDWVLNIDMARTSDRGHYECQVNTDPKINLGFRLNVLRKSIYFFKITFNFFCKNFQLLTILCMASLNTLDIRKSNSCQGLKALGF